MAFSARSWRTPDTISVLATVPAPDVEALRELLPSIEPQLHLAELPMVHFLRVLVIDAALDLRGRPLPARLVLSVVFDGDAESMLTAWVGLAGEHLVDIFGGCVGGPSQPDQVVPFLLSQSVRPGTFHIGTVGSTVEQVREEERCANELRGFVDANYPTGQEATAAQVLASARAFVKGRPDLLQEPRPARTLRSKVLKQLDLARASLVVLGAPLVAAAVSSRVRRTGVCGFARDFIAATALAAGGVVALVRYLEITEPDVVIGQDDAAVALLEDDEDFITQNQFTMVADVRDSVTRRLLMRATLFLSDVYSKHFESAGKLRGVNTIHFARIHQIDEGRRFLFMSDFDGGWNRYLFDFLTVGSFAVVPNWANLRGCPKTLLQFIPRPGFAQRFLPFTRASQIPSDIWYSARPTVTVRDVINHAEIREGLFAEQDAVDAGEWVRRL